MPTPSKFRPNKKIAFTFIMIMIPIIVLISLELVLRIVDYGDEYPLFVESLDQEQKIYYNINPDIAKRYFGSSNFGLDKCWTRGQKKKKILFVFAY